MRPGRGLSPGGAREEHGRVGDRGPNNLPLTRTTFAGRGPQLQELDRLLDAAAVVTLVGPGGVGKTRLALEHARRALDRFPDGVWLVDLSATRSTDRVPVEVAAVLAVTAGPGDAVRLVAEQLRDRRVLLVVDGCEHLVDAVASLVDRLAAACADLRVLATSREPLGLAAETCLRVPPLDLGGEAVELFVDRALAADSRFRLAPEDRAVVASLCARLDGLPLAIELAASWTRVLSPDELLRRLDNRFDLLTATRRDLPARQRTMRATVEWSHQLLSDPQRVLFRRLAVFGGSFALEGPERVCSGPPLSPDRVAGILAGLHERSMVVVDRSPAGATRYRLLDTLRDFADERLRESGELDELRRRHFVHYLERAEAVDARRLDTGSDAGVAALLPDGDNLRRALQWSIDEDPPGALRLAGALEGFWMVRSVSEGRRWLQLALERAPEPTPQRARALVVSPLVVAGGIPWPEARRMVEAAIAIYDGAGDSTGAAMARLTMALAAFFNGELDEARARVEEALARHAGLPHPLFHARASTYLGCVGSFAPHGLDEGRRRLAEGLDRSRAIGDGWGEGLALTILGLAELRAGERESAARRLRAAIQVNLQAGVTATAVGGLGILALEAGDARRGCTLLEAAAAVRERTGVHGFPVEIGRRFERAHQAVARRLAPPVIERCRALARAMTTDEVLADALDEAPSRRFPADRLTARQQEVALLVADGLTNREISERLRLSVRTVESHVDAVLSTLGFHSRARLAAWAQDAGLPGRAP
jgi:non-specific serine/threonine protein kinase